MIDLHIHTNKSDGKHTPIEILEKAEKLGLECISITDHDNCDAYEILENISIKKYYSGKVIKGCELSSTYKNIPIEILGYNIDCSSINHWHKTTYSENKIWTAKSRHLKELKRIFDMQKVKYDKSIEIKGISDSPAKIMYSELLKHESNLKILDIDNWFNIDTFIRNYCNNKNSAFYIDRTEDFPKIDEVVEVIKKSGGLAFIAHIYMYGVEDNIEFLNSIIKDLKLDGVECYYSTFNNEQTQFLINYCNENNLYISGGSDYHGTVTKSEIDLGIGRGTLNVPSEIISPWGEYLA